MVGVVAVLAAAALAGVWGVALVAPPIVLAGHWRTEDLWYKRLFNVGVYLLGGAAFAGVFFAFGDNPRPNSGRRC